MRCQKVRSYLSAYCNDELSGSVLRKVSDHLTACDHCRSEEIHYRELRSNAGTINTYKVSEGFNNRLLDRIAKERFNETRTKAYLPKDAPSIIIRRVVPILVTACLAIMIVISNFTGDDNSQPTNYASTNGQLDDSYRTVQPVNNPYMSGMMHKDWTLGEQLARTERYNRISEQLTLNVPFNYFGQGNAVNVSNRSSRPTPFVDGFYRIRPVIIVFESARPTTNKEAEAKY